MVLINYAGRLGNNMLQYAAAKIFSDKFKIKLVSKPFSGGFDFSHYVKTNETYDHKICDGGEIIVNNDNFLELLSNKNNNCQKYIFSDFFQINEFVSNYIDQIKNVYIDQKEKKTGLFIHYRIGDIENTNNMLPIEYYIECLETLGINEGVISSDSPNHKNVKFISEKYNLNIIDDHPLSIIDLGRKYNNIILSEGTFSWWIGVLSSADKIFYNKRERFWHGDIFTFDDWIDLNYK